MTDSNVPNEDNGNRRIRQMAGRSVLVVGANGFVGSHVARALVNAGHRVTGFGMPLDVDLIADLRERVQMCIGSAETPADVSGAFDAARPDAVVWAAGHNANASGLFATGESDPARALSVNALGLFNVLQAAQQRGVQRAVITGSLVSFGPASFYSTTHVDEDAQLRPTTGYGLSKALGEHVAQYFRERFCMDVSTLRLSVVFGPGRWYGGVVSTLNRLLAEARPGDSAQCTVPAEPFDLVHVADVATATRLAIESPRPLRGAYHVNSLTTTYAELARSIERQVPGYRIHCTTVPAPIVYPLMKFDLIREDLGFTPAYDLDGAIADCLKHR